MTSTGPSKIKEESAAVTRAAFEKNAAAARIDELTAEYMNYQIGADLLEKAMARYRLKHQDPILRSAGEYFSALTRGAFSGLTIAHEDNDRVMKGVRANGEELNIDGMSDRNPRPAFSCFCGWRISRITAPQTRRAR